MKDITYEVEQEEVDSLIERVKSYIDDREFVEAYAEVANGMRLYPNLAVPHNLMGLIMEYTGNKMGAMKHYRAAFALDPSYTPARYNMERCGNLSPNYNFAFCERDCASVKYAPRKKTWR